jgi:solute carrier family 13 (sodium-dependent dicarboxylate transporter), member 2/3/5
MLRSADPTPAAASAPVALRVLLAPPLAAVLAAGLWFGLPALAAEGRLALLVFALAIVAWTVLRLPEMPVAVAAAGALVLLGVTPIEDFHRSLGDGLVWLLICAFVLGAVIRASGLAERYVLAAVAGAGSVRRLFHRLTWVIGATAFLVPSTSGRAALLLPVFLCLAGALSQRRLVRALALLFPTVILLSACGSLLGAGAHLIAIDVIARLGLPAPGFFDWALLGLPIALATSVAATELILWLFLTRAERGVAPALPARSPEPLTRPQRWVLAITVATTVAFATTPWHGVDASLVALGGALAATCSGATGVSMKAALKGVEWSLILFLAATLTLGHALLASGAAEWIATQALAAVPAAVRQQPTWLLGAVVLVAMLSHLVITSRSARAAVLIPTLALPLAVQPTQAAQLILVVTIASGFCQTLMVSAKPVALYARGTAGAGDENASRPAAFSEADLLRLSLALMPVFALLVLAAVLWLWPWLGAAPQTVAGLGAFGAE